MILLNVLDTFAGSESVKPCPGYLGDLWPWLPLGGEQGNHKHISISSVITREKNKREREREECFVLRLLLWRQHSVGFYGNTAVTVFRTGGL